MHFILVTISPARCPAPTRDKEPRSKIDKFSISDKQYAETPVIFYNDNYDHCMLRGDEALFCSITYKLNPLNTSESNDVWKTIEVSRLYIVLNWIENLLKNNLFIKGTGI